MCELYSYCCSDLSFEKGDTIRLLKKVDQNWMSGEYNGATGLFPVNYVKVLLLKLFFKLIYLCEAVLSVLIN